MLRVDVLDHGFVEIDNVSHHDSEDHPPFEAMEAMDLAVANAARVSLGARSSELTDKDRGLIRRLMRDHHATPFEHPVISWRVKAPILVLREWHRHRTATISEISARYVEVAEEFYVPAAKDVRAQVGKSMDYTFEALPPGEAEHFRREMRQQNEQAFELYRRFIEKGIAKEVARSVLPVATYSEMLWTCNVRNLMGFLNLRNAAPAQREIRMYAAAMEGMWAQVMPVTAAAFAEFGRQKP